MEKKSTYQNLECFKTISEHKLPINCIIQLSNFNIVTDSSDKTIKFFSDFKCINSINTDNEINSILEFKLINLLAGCGNNVNIYDYNYQLLFVFRAHIDLVSSLVSLTNNTFASGAFDRKIIIWKYNQKEIDSFLDGHEGAITSLILLKNGNLCSSSRDNTIKLWDLKNKSCIHTIENIHNLWINQIIQTKDGKLLSCSEDMTICIKDLKFRNPQNIVRLFDSIEVKVILEMNEDYIISGNKLGQIIVWNNKKQIQIINEHKKDITGLIFDKDGNLISCGKDGLIKYYKNRNKLNSLD
jgi:WD40 repeat protein